MINSLLNDVSTALDKWESKIEKDQSKIIIARQILAGLSRAYNDGDVKTVKSQLARVERIINETE